MENLLQIIRLGDGAIRRLPPISLRHAIPVGIRCQPERIEVQFLDGIQQYSGQPGDTDGRWVPSSRPLPTPIGYAERVGLKANLVSPEDVVSLATDKPQEIYLLSRRTSAQGKLTLQIDELSNGQVIQSHPIDDLENTLFCEISVETLPRDAGG